MSDDDNMPQRNFEPTQCRVEKWRELNTPKHLAGVVHDLYFNPNPKYG